MPRLLGWLRPRRVPRRPHLQLVVGDPIPYDELLAAATCPDGRLDLRSTSDMVMRRVTALLAGIAGEDLPHLLEESYAPGEARPSRTLQNISQPNGAS